MPRMQHASDRVLEYFRSADLAEATLVLHWVKVIVKERQPAQAQGSVQPRRRGRRKKTSTTSTVEVNPVDTTFAGSDR